VVLLGAIGAHTAEGRVVTMTRILSIDGGGILARLVTPAPAR
jgi:hypothetical protein